VKLGDVFPKENLGGGKGRASALKEGKKNLNCLKGKDQSEVRGLDKRGKRTPLSQRGKEKVGGEGRNVPLP